MQYELSICIPARNEEWLGRTIQDLLEHTSEKTEVIAILDGYLPDPPLDPDPRVTVIYNPVSVGQRAACNQAAKLSKAKYLMKVDAHVAVDENFDDKMIQGFKEQGDDVTMIPIMKNLHVFDWLCKKCGNRWYQSPTPTQCLKSDGTTPSGCDSKEFEKDVVWKAKPSPNSTSFQFDKTLHFQYFSEYQRSEKYRKDLESGFTETMSIQGSCFMCTREKYFELGLCGEEFHSWGQQGVEVACKTWLSGGRVLCNHNTWYAHCFRTRGGDFGFPYPNPGDKVRENRELSRELFKEDKWPKATRKFQWLIDRFNPPDWGITKGAIYYTHNGLDEKIAKPVRDRIAKICRRKGIQLTCSSLKKMDFGDLRVHFPSMRRGYLAMFKQILGALEKSSADYIFFTEHDVLYHESHFDFVPKDKDTFYYNQNVWNLRLPDGHAMHYDVNQLSGLCVWRDAAVTHFRERFEMAEKEYERLKAEGKEGEELERHFNRFVRNMGFEPFTHGRVNWVNQFKCDTWKSEYPNIDVKHGQNATPPRWKKEQYRNQKLLVNWRESDTEIEGWGQIKNIIKTLQ